MNAAVFWCGLAGVGLAVVGVEAFNEYFDSRMGTDRVFNPEDEPPMSDWVMWLGVAGFAGAFAIRIYLTFQGGWPILAFAVLGGLAAVFYVAPPIRWAYRGLGETLIALSYGPWMVLGSLYLLGHTLSWPAFFASLVPGLLIMALAVVNAIPDFHQDRLVGKRNLRPAGPAASRVSLCRPCHRWLGGRSRRAIAGIFPLACLAALFAVPLLIASGRSAMTTYGSESPREFIPAIRAIVSCYMVTVTLFTLAIAFDTLVAVR